MNFKLTKHLTDGCIINENSSLSLFIWHCTCDSETSDTVRWCGGSERSVYSPASVREGKVASIELKYNMGAG